MSPERLTCGIKLYLWIERHGPPPDFLRYPARVVDEVMHLQSIAEEMWEDIRESDRRVAEWHKRSG